MQVSPSTCDAVAAATRNPSEASRRTCESVARRFIISLLCGDRVPLSLLNSFRVAGRFP